MIVLKADKEYEFKFMPNYFNVQNTVVAISKSNDVPTRYILYVLVDGKMNVLYCDRQITDYMQKGAINKKINFFSIYGNKTVRFKTRSKVSWYDSTALELYDFENIDMVPICKEGDEKQVVIDLYNNVPNLSDVEKNIEEYLKIAKRSDKMKTIL